MIRLIKDRNETNARCEIVVLTVQSKSIGL